MCRTGLPLWRTRCALEERAAEPLYFRRRYSGAKIEAREQVQEEARWKSGLFHVEHRGRGRDKTKGYGQTPGGAATRAKALIFDPATFQRGLKTRSPGPSPGLHQRLGAIGRPSAHKNGVFPGCSTWNSL